MRNLLALVGVGLEMLIGMKIVGFSGGEMVLVTIDGATCW